MWKHRGQGVTWGRMQTPDLNSQTRTDPVAISGMGSVKGTGKFRKLNVTLGNLTIHLTPLSGKEEPLDPPVPSEKTGAEPPSFCTHLASCYEQCDRGDQPVPLDPVTVKNGVGRN